MIPSCIPTHKWVFQEKKEKYVHIPSEAPEEAVLMYDS